MHNTMFTFWQLNVGEILSYLISVILSAGFKTLNKLRCNRNLIVQEFRQNLIFRYISNEETHRTVYTTWEASQRIILCQACTLQLNISLQKSLRQRYDTNVNKRSQCLQFVLWLDENGCNKIKSSSKFKTSSTSSLQVNSEFIVESICGVCLLL